MFIRSDKGCQGLGCPDIIFLNSSLPTESQRLDALPSFLWKEMYSAEIHFTELYVLNKIQLQL